MNIDIPAGDKTKFRVPEGVDTDIGKPRFYGYAVKSAEIRYLASWKVGQLTSFTKEDRMFGSLE